MKRTAIFLSVLIISISAFAQDMPMELSFSGGSSVNWMNPGNTMAKRGNIEPGFDFGVNGDFFFNIHNTYAITTGLLYTHTEGEIDYHSDVSMAGETISAGSSIRYRIHSLEIPFALKLRTVPFRRWTYWGQFGVSNFINIDTKASSSDGALYKTDINDNFRLFNIALNVGAGANFDLGSENSVIMGIVYKNGLLDQTKNDIDGRTTINSIQFKIGLIF
ncbi:MAG: outer membrane beta-barrel protein [Prolixibacteraceae bacterium]|nr:outer membrane beta-barrel protein [Prolixibacteraceae bacterium]